jgi:hypothetical protein
VTYLLLATREEEAGDCRAKSTDLRELVPFIRQLRLAEGWTFEVTVVLPDGFVRELEEDEQRALDGHLAEAGR